MKSNITNLFTKTAIRLIAMVGISIVGYLIFGVLHPSIAEAAYSLPYGAGATPQLGIGHLHGGNFSYMQDDNGTSYYLANNTESDESLDMGYAVTSGSSAPASATALDTGTVVAINTYCHQIIVSYGGGTIWGMYIHVVPATGLYDGESVSAGTVLGTPKAVYPCTETGYATFAHVHFAFMTKTDSTHGRFFSMVNQVLCGYTVLSDANAGHSGGNLVNLQGLSSLNIPSIPSSCSGSSTTPPPSPSPANLTLTSSSIPTNGALGQSYSANFTVQNTGGSSFNLSELSLWAEDPEGNSFKIYGDANSAAIGAGSSRTLTVPSGYNFATGNVSNSATCWSCVDGTYTITPEFQENGPPVQLNPVGSGDNQVQVNVISQRIGAIDNSGTAYVKDGSLSATWVQIGSNDTQIAMSGFSIGVLDTSGNFYVKTGDLSATYVTEATSVAKIAVYDNMLGYIDTSGNFYVSEGGSGWVQEGTNIQSMALSDYYYSGYEVIRIGEIDNTNTLNVKEGSLTATWQSEQSSASTFALAGTRIGVISSGTAYAKDGSLTATWVSEAGNVTSIYLNGSRLGVLGTDSYLYVKDGDLYATYVQEAGYLGAAAIYGSRIGILGSGNIYVKDGDLYATFVTEMGSSPIALALPDNT